MTLKQKKLVLVLSGVALLAIATGLVLKAMNENLEFYLTPSQMAEKTMPEGRVFRLGGMVETGSIKRNGIDVSFRVTDTARTVPVNYTGILPDLFSEGKGTVVVGTLADDGSFKAREVLAKHDENYMPPEAAAAMKAAKDAQSGAPAYSGSTSYGNGSKP